MNKLKSKIKSFALTILIISCLTIWLGIFALISLCDLLQFKFDKLLKRKESIKNILTIVLSK